MCKLCVYIWLNFSNHKTETFPAVATHAMGTDLHTSSKNRELNSLALNEFLILQATGKMKLSKSCYTGIKSQTCKRIKGTLSPKENES